MRAHLRAGAIRALFVLLLIGVAAADAAPAFAQRARVAFAPVGLYRYPNAGISEADSLEAIAEANLLLRQAGYTLVVVQQLQPADVFALVRRGCRQYDVGAFCRCRPPGLMDDDGFRPFPGFRQPI